MADHAKVNLKELDDMAAKRGQEGLEARFGRKAMGDSSASGVSYFRYDPDFKTPFGHDHAEQEETYVVLSGGGSARIGAEDIELRPFDALRVPPGTPRSLAAGPEGMEVIAFGAGPSGDAEMINDFW